MAKVSVHRFNSLTVYILSYIANVSATDGFTELHFYAICPVVARKQTFDPVTFADTTVEVVERDTLK